MGKREFLQKAHQLDLEKHGVGGRYWSRKLNGMRCWWDGGVSNGINKCDVPWSNMDKDERYQDQQMATGLWTQNGNVIAAPQWFIALLPKVPLDGELYCEGWSLQQIVSAVKPLVPDARWKSITLNCFDMPSMETILETGVISAPHFKKVIGWTVCNEFIGSFPYELFPKKEWPYWKSYHFLQRVLLDNKAALLVEQLELPMAQKYAVRFIKEELDRITTAGGEGIIIRHPDFPYECERSYHLLKMKKYKDAEGTVIGYTTGKVGKEGRLLGLMGNLILRLENGKTLEISGFQQPERMLVQQGDQPECDRGYDATGWARANPGCRCPDWITNDLFPRGTEVTFRYRDLTDDDIPVEAYYHRIRRQSNEHDRTEKNGYPVR